MNSKDVALSAILAALYALGVTLLAPISFQIFQIRVADMLLPLSILFGLPAVIGLSLGTIVANLSSPFGMVDIGGGTLANLIATYVAWKMTRRYRTRGSQFLATLVQTAIITLIVGTYLQFLLQIPDSEFLGLVMPGLAITLIGVLLGSLVAINLAGFALLKAVETRLIKIKSY